MRLKLATTLRNRSSVTTRDARLLNSVVDSRSRVQKRPSLVAQYEVTTAAQGLGLISRTTPRAAGGITEELVVITGTVLTTNPNTYVEETHILDAFNFGGGTFGLNANGPGTGGTITPTTLSGATILEFFSETTQDSTSIRLSRTPVPPSDFFTSVRIGAVTLLSADATYGTVGSEALWQWQVGNLVPSDDTYDVGFV